MKRRRHTPEQIIRKLREAERLQAEGADIATVARQLEVSEQTFHRWRAQYGGMKADDAKRLKELERENARLKRIVADLSLDNAALREVAKGRMKVKSSWAPPSFVGVPSRRRCAGRRSPRVRLRVARAGVAVRG
jgi:putative transposase